MFTTRGAATERADTVPDFLFAVGCIRSATSMTRCCCSLLDPREARSRPFACVSRAHPWRSPCIPGCRTLRGHHDCVPACGEGHRLGPGGGSRTRLPPGLLRPGPCAERSEEHTSELQSRLPLV